MLFILLFFFSVDIWKSRCVLISKIYGEWITSLFRIQNTLLKLYCSEIQLSHCYRLYTFLALRAFGKEFIFILDNFHIVDLLCSIVCVIPISSESFSFYFVPSVCLWHFHSICRYRYCTSGLRGPICKTVSCRKRNIFCIKIHKNKYFIFIYYCNTLLLNIKQDI